MAEELCRDLSVPFGRIGSLVLAFSDEEMDTVWDLYDRGIKNGVPGVEVIMPDKIREMEPQISDKLVGALWAPSAGIINPWDYTLAFAETAVRNGAEVKLNTCVTGIEKAEDHYVIHTNQGDVEAQYIINAAGANAPQINEMVGDTTLQPPAPKPPYQG